MKVGIQSWVTDDAVRDAAFDVIAWTKRDHERKLAEKATPGSVALTHHEVLDLDDPPTRMEWTLGRSLAEGETAVAEDPPARWLVRSSTRSNEIASR